MKQGLQAAASLLAANAGLLTLLLVLSCYADAEIDEIKKIIARSGRTVALHILKPSLGGFPAFRGHHGNHMVYCR